MTIGEKVFFLRKEYYGWTRKELAKKVFNKANDGAIKRIERYGQEPKYSILCQLAKVLNVRVTDLINDHWEPGLIKRLNLQI